MDSQTPSTVTPGPEPTTTPTSNISQAPQSSLNNPGKRKFKIILIAFFIIFFLTMGTAAAIYTFKEASRGENIRQTISPTPYPATTANPDWKTYSNTPGKYQISYPINYKINIGKSTSLDGVVLPQMDTYVELISDIIPGTNGNMKISINSTETNYKTARDVASSAGCPEISNSKGADYKIDNTNALIFENTNCSALGITIIDFIKNGRAYTIGIEGTASYEKLKPVYSQLLSTFKFTDATGETSTECVVGGCSGQLCGEATDDDGMISTCEYTAAYACYKTASCARQTDGKCGWTQTEALTTCLESAK